MAFSHNHSAATFLTERHNVLELMANLLAMGKHERVVQLGRRYANLFDRYSLWEEWWQLAEMGLSAAQEMEDQVSAARFLLEHAFIQTECARGKEDLDRAHDFATQALKLATHHEAYGLMGDITTALGNIACRSGDHQAALGHFRRAIDYYGRRRDWRYPEKTVNNAANCKLHAGEIDSALSDFTDLLQRRQERGDEVGAANVLTNMSSAHLSADRPKEALDAADQAISLYRQHRVERELAEALVNRANALLALGDESKGVAELEVALKTFQQLGDAPSIELASAYLDWAKTRRAT